MALVKTRIVEEPSNRELRLAEMQLHYEGLILAVAAARDGAAMKTDLHCANAAGTFAYQHGTHALRENFVGSGWFVDRDSGVESIVHPELKLKVAFANVDQACKATGPKPLGRKGSGVERVCSGNLNLFNDLPEYAPQVPSDFSMYYLMVDSSGAAELTSPVVVGDTFTAYVERIYLTDGSDVTVDPVEFSDADATNEFDPVVKPK